MFDRIKAIMRDYAYTSNEDWEELKQAEQRIKELKRENENLAWDNNFLTNEEDSLIEENKHLSKRIDELTTDLVEIREYLDYRIKYQYNLLNQMSKLIDENKQLKEDAEKVLIATNEDYRNFIIYSKELEEDAELGRAIALFMARKDVEITLAETPPGCGMTDFFDTEDVLDWYREQKEGK